MITSERDAMAYCADVVDENQLTKLRQFVDLLVQENGQQNLIAPSTVSEIWKRHIVDSLQLMEFERHIESAIDLGSGAGLPGVVLAIAMPETQWNLIESRKLRIDWLNKLRDYLYLDKVIIHGGPVEKANIGTVNLITGRAFAPLPKLLKLARRFSTADTLWLLPKGRSARQEWQALSPSSREMFHVEQSLTSEDAGIIVGRGKPEI